METSDPKYKHKPSEKHTLEEVLKSLQDLIRNDLAEGAAAAGKQEPAPAEPRQHEDTARGMTEAKPRHENTAGLREDFAPVSPGSGPVNLDAVMRSLKDLIGNELNVGDEPKPPESKSVVHEEYLAAEEKIEEYIPDELGQLEDELNIGEPAAPEQAASESPHDEPFAPEGIIEEITPERFTPLDEELTLEELAEVAPLTPDAAEPTPPRDESPAHEEIVEASLPEEFVPLDEELTFEKPPEIASPAPVLPETPELPGEISLELLGEPETTPPAITETPPAMKEDIAPGTQHEIFFEEPPTPSGEPQAAPTDSVSASEPELAPQAIQEPVADVSQSPAEETALPTIEVEESFDTGNYFDGAALSAENSPAALEEIILQDMEISNAPGTTPPAVETSPAAPTDVVPAPESPPAPVEKKVTLEIVEEPTSDGSPKASVDFDALGLEPSQPEQAPPPVVADIPAPEAESPVTTAKPDATPAPKPKPPKAVEKTPTVETKAETAPRPAQPPAPAEPGTTKTPPTLNLDDIPVLNEVVAPPAGSAPVAKPDAPPSTLPAPDRARDIVVRAVAKLNVEMRKTGGAGLDTKTILRLQQLIRQELEKGGEK